MSGCGAVPVYETECVFGSVAVSVSVSVPVAVAVSVPVLDDEHARCNVCFLYPAAQGRCYRLHMLLQHTNTCSVAV